MQKPAPHAKPDAHAAAGHCPGHGPMDPPGHVNWYQGLLGVDNERAVKGNSLQKLLWRYKNTDDECDPLNQEPPVLASAINLAVVLLVLLRFGKAPIKEALVKRKRDMMQDIDAASTLKSSAEERLSSYKKQLAKIEDRRKELHAEYRAQGEAERKRLIAEAEEKSARLRREAELRVAQEGRQVEADLLREATLSAVAAAEELLKKRIQGSDHDRLADEYLASVGVAIKASSGAAARPA